MSRGSRAPATDTASWRSLTLAEAASEPPETVLDQLESSSTGLTSAEAVRRRALVGPNVIRSHRVRPWQVFARQVRSPLLALLVVTATISFFVGDRADAVIIGLIVGLSVGLGFVNEYRAERAAEALHQEIRHEVPVRRDGSLTSLGVTELVPGDVVHLEMGAVVPADLRLIETGGLDCDESVLTGESMPADKAVAAVIPGAALADYDSCAFMGTVVHQGAAEAVVVATGGRTEFGQIAQGLGERQADTEFQVGLRQFSGLLVRVAAALTFSIFVINVALSRPIIDALLFSLAIAVGITPQLLPAVVTTSLAAGARQLARRKVLVKRLVCIEDLGDVDVLFTDKTGTLTDGHISLVRRIDGAGHEAPDLLRLGLICNDAEVEDGHVVSGNALDTALWEAAEAKDVDLASTRVVARLPFDHERRLTSILADDANRDRRLITKGAPEAVLDRCIDVSATARGLLAEEFAAGNRVVAVATRSASNLEAITTADEHDLALAGFLVFLDQPKANAAASIARLAALGVEVKIVTGDNAIVAEKVCADLGIRSTGTLEGAAMDALDDGDLADRVAASTIFARVSPQQKARIITVQRRSGSDVAFLGDGVNDAVALHRADVGISVDAATDVAKDAADVVLLEKDLGVLADGVAEGRRIFANTIKYVLMGTSSNFGNMFSAAAASAFLPFLPMLPGQILLNNLLYDTSQLMIPTDHVDEEQVARPAHWDIRFIRRFMLWFGPISSIFDFITFGIMRWGFHAGPALFRSGWFVESLATQTLVVFVIRTRRIPFFRSRPSWQLATAAIAVVLVGAYLPMSPVNHALGFTPLPAGFFSVLVVMVVAYLALAEQVKRVFFARYEHTDKFVRRSRAHRLRRRATRWRQHGPLPELTPAPRP
jgi:Mg2+-importing ATPase